MQYYEELSRSGSWLFRWRSYFPLIFLALVLAALHEFTYLGGTHTLDLVWEAVCVAVSMSGLAVRAYTIGYSAPRTSGRVTRAQEARTLNVTGAYSLVRNPLYLGNFLMWLGLAVFPHSWMLVPVFVLAFWLYYERIVIAEEAFLEARFGAEYREWASKTPVFVPRLSGFVKPDIPFSWRLVFRREYSGFFAVFAVMFLFEVVGDAVVTGRFHLDPIWCAIFAGSLTIYLTLRTLHRHTKLLREPARQP